MTGTKPVVQLSTEALDWLTVAEATDGTVLTVSVPPEALEGDVLQLRWGSQLLTQVLGAVHLSAGQVQVTVPAETVQTEGSRTVEVRAQLLDSASAEKSPLGDPVTVKVDLLQPMVSVTKAEASNGQMVFTFSFTEPVFGFSHHDLQVTDGQLVGFQTITESQLFQARVVGANARVSVRGGNAYTDGAGQTGLTHTQANKLVFSADTGSSSTDRVTNVQTQTVSGSLDLALALTETLEVSAGGGQWVQAQVSGTSFTASGVTLQGGAGSILSRVVDASTGTKTAAIDNGS